MSGGGNPAPIRDREPACASILVETILNSPISSVIGQLKKGDILTVDLHRQGAVISLVALHKNAIAGSITSSIVGRLIECIQDGHSYVAEVVKIQGGACTVLIRAE